MFDNFFRILTSEKSYENEYVMRAVMRLSSSLHEGVVPYLNLLIEKLVMILRRSSRVCIDKLLFQNHSEVFYLRIQINRISIIIYLKRLQY